MIERPQTLPQAEAMIGVLLRRVLGGNETIDIVLRHRIKGESIRQIARENGCMRLTVKRKLESFQQTITEMETAARAANGAVV